MEAKEEAIQLINDFFYSAGLTVRDYENSKQCAIICCNTHIYGKNNTPFSSFKEWEKDNDKWLSIMVELEKL